MTKKVRHVDKYHSINLDVDRCIGCTRCIRNCPTEAIRVQDEKARIISERCIDCGECIRSCLQKAKSATGDTLNDLKEYKYTIGLVAPTVYAQFSNAESIGAILAAVKKLGFDEVVEVAEGADYVTVAVKDYIENYSGPKPLISSSCPAVVRLIRVKYPVLLNHLIPIESPMEVMAGKLRTEKSKELGLDSEQIGIFFLSPCPAKMTAVRAPLGIKYSEVDGVISLGDVYGDVLKNLNGQLEKAKVKASVKGIGWAKAGGERAALQLLSQFAVDGIHNVIKVLDELEMGKLQDVDYMECLACPGGCLGGPLTMENPYSGAMRLRRLMKDLDIAPDCDYDELLQFYHDNKELFQFSEKIPPKDITKLSDNMVEAILRMERLEQIVENELPGLDCGACGAPNCRALAQDIVTNYRTVDDCIVLIRRKLKEQSETE